MVKVSEEGKMIIVKMMMMMLMVIPVASQS